MVKKISAPPLPIHWQRIEIRNYRVLTHLVLERPTGDESRGQWTVLIGENGVGKTSLLQALAIKVSDRKPASSWAYVTDGGSEAKYELEVVHAGGSISTHEFLPWEPVWAYGSQRGNALGGPDRSVDLKTEPFLDSLLDSNRRLIHAETWLKNLQLAALQNGKDSQQLLAGVKATLLSILPEIVDLEILSEGVYLRREDATPVRLQDWSDGYLTTAGWILDLIANWVKYAKSKQIDIGANFREQIAGLVLIDEIDLHLHPAWQTQIIRDLRRLFPRLSFFVTTHNPLTLLGAEPGEIFVMRRNAEGEIEAIQRDLPPGIDVDQVLTGDWFGLSSTLDSGTLRLLDHHRELLRAGTASDDPVRRQLESELRQRLGTYGDTSVDRMVQSIAAELMPPAPADLGPEERAALREKILAVARKNRR